MQLSKKPKAICCNFIAFLESTLNSQHFHQKKKKKKKRKERKKERKKRKIFLIT